MPAPRSFTNIKPLSSHFSPDQDDVKAGLPCHDCPENRRCLVAVRKEVGSLAWAREWLARPVTSESTMFPASLFEPYLLPNESFQPYYSKPYGEEQRYEVASAWDLAWGEGITGDYMVKCTGVVAIRPCG